MVDAADSKSALSNKVLVRVQSSAFPLFFIELYSPVIILESMSEQKLLHLLQKKRGFFEAILDLSEDEQQLPIPDWVSVLEQKKVLLSCIDEIDYELSPFKAKLHNLSQEITDELSKTRTVVEKILHLDTRNQKLRKKMLRDE